MSFGFYFALFTIIVILIIGVIFYNKNMDFFKNPFGVFSFVGGVGKGIGKGFGDAGKGFGNTFGIR